MTFGMMSPPFSTITRSPGRMSRRSTSCSLCSVAIWTVVPLSRTGLEHGKRRHGARAAHVHVDPDQPRRRLFGRELERGGPSRELRRHAEALAERQVVELDDDAVGFELAARAGPRAIRRRTQARRRCPRTAASASRPDSPQSCELLQRSRRELAAGGVLAGRHHDLIAEGTQSAPRHGGGIERANRAGCRIPRVRKRRLARPARARRSSSSKAARGRYTSPRTSISAGACVAAQLQGNRANHANVRRHVLAEHAVAARCAARPAGRARRSARCSGRRS